MAKYSYRAVIPVVKSKKAPLKRIPKMLPRQDLGLRDSILQSSVKPKVSALTSRRK